MVKTAREHPNRADAPGRLGDRSVNRVGYGAMQLEKPDRSRR